MFEQWEQLIDKDKGEDELNRVECKISMGVLTDLFVFFPAGCHGLARCRVFLGMKPVAPRSPKLFLAGDDGPINVRGLVEPIRPNLPVLNWELWNLDETYTHTLWLGATWTPLEESELEQMIEQLKSLNLNILRIPALLKGRQIT